MRSALVVGLLVLSGAAAGAQDTVVAKVQCFHKDVLTMVEVNYRTKEVRQWATFTNGHTNGPFGPFKADISPEKIFWLINNSKGKAYSVSYYTLDRRKKTLDIKIDNGPDEDGWQRLDTPCSTTK